MQIQEYHPPTDRRQWQEERADYDEQPGETTREWYARRAREWRELGPEGWIERRIAAFAVALQA